MGISRCFSNKIQDFSHLPPPFPCWRLPATSGAGPSMAAAASRPLRWRSSFRVPSHLEIRSSFRAEITSFSETQ